MAIENNQPLVSIIMPVYNCEKYIVQAVNSVLQQTYTNFELIILEDASTDNTLNILKKISDERIKLIINEKNIGLINNLNKGISLVSFQAKYIARMDGDDVCLNNRLEKQIYFLEKNQQVDVVASTVTLIDENNNNIGVWSDDVQNVSTKEIRSFLWKNNCIAHPTVVIKADVLKAFQYETTQKLSEDYDLWLRLTSQNKIIAKLNEPLVLHRILSTSFTRTRNINLFTRMRKVKWQFTLNELKQRRLNFFILKTFISGCLDIVKGTVKSAKKLFRV